MAASKPPLGLAEDYNVVMQQAHPWAGAGCTIARDPHLSAGVEPAGVTVICYWFCSKFSPTDTPNSAPACQGRPNWLNNK
jgi:hypothetical protein